MGIFDWDYKGGHEKTNFSKAKRKVLKEQTEVRRLRAKAEKEELKSKIEISKARKREASQRGHWYSGRGLVSGASGKAGKSGKLRLI